MSPSLAFFLTPLRRIMFSITMISLELTMNFFSPLCREKVEAFSSPNPIPFLKNRFGKLPFLFQTSKAGQSVVVDIHGF